MTAGYWLGNDLGKVQIELTDEAAFLTMRGVITAAGIRALRPEISRLISSEPWAWMVVSWVSCLVTMSAEQFRAELATTDCHSVSRRPIAWFVSREQRDVFDRASTVAAQYGLLREAFTDYTEALRWAESRGEAYRGELLRRGMMATPRAGSSAR